MYIISARHLYHILISLWNKAGRRRVLITPLLACVTKLLKQISPHFFNIPQIKVWLFCGYKIDIDVQRDPFPSYWYQIFQSNVVDSDIRKSDFLRQFQFSHFTFFEVNTRYTIANCNIDAARSVLPVWKELSQAVHRARAFTKARTLSIKESIAVLKLRNERPWEW